MIGMIGMIVTTLFALGCFLFVVSLPLQSAGSSLRRIGLTLIVIPLAGCIFFGALVETFEQRGVGVALNPSMILGLLVLSVIAYLALQVRRTFSHKSGRTPFRIREKRPVDPTKRGTDLVSLLRDQLRGDDE